MLINRKLANLKNNAKCTSFPKLKKLVKKLSNLTRTRKEKSHCLISHSLAHFVEFIKRPCFSFAEGLTGLTDGLAIGRAELRGKEIAIGFFRSFCKE